MTKFIKFRNPFNLNPCYLSADKIEMVCIDKINDLYEVYATRIGDEENWRFTHLSSPFETLDEADKAMDIMINDQIGVRWMIPKGTSVV